MSLLWHTLLLQRAKTRKPDRSAPDRSHSEEGSCKIEGILISTLKNTIYFISTLKSKTYERQESLQNTADC